MELVILLEYKLNAKLIIYVNFGIFIYLSDIFKYKQIMFIPDFPMTSLYLSQLCCQLESWLLIPALLA